MVNIEGQGCELSKDGQVVSLSMMTSSPMPHKLPAHVDGPRWIVCGKQMLLLSYHFNCCRVINCAVRHCCRLRRRQRDAPAEDVVDRNDGAARDLTRRGWSSGDCRCDIDCRKISLYAALPECFTRYVSDGHLHRVWDGAHPCTTSVWAMCWNCPESVRDFGCLIKLYRSADSRPWVRSALKQVATKQLFEIGNSMQCKLVDIVET